MNSASGTNCRQARARSRRSPPLAATPCRRTTRERALSPESGASLGPSSCMAASYEETRRSCAGPEKIRWLFYQGLGLERPLDAQAALVLIGVRLERRQAGGVEHNIRGKDGRPRLVQMHIHVLGADIEPLERRPDEIGSGPAFLEVRDANRAAKAGQRIAGIMHLHVRAVDPRAQSR